MMCVPEPSTLAHVLTLLGTGTTGFFIIDALRVLMRGRQYRTWDEQPLDPACMRLGERMERQADYVRRVERQS